MSENLQIKSALISVFHKDGLEPIIRLLHEHGVRLISTGGTYSFIEKLGIPATKVEDLTGYPSILDGRVKTLHPGVFGGILARRDESHIKQCAAYEIGLIDLVIVDLYPFEETLRQTDDEQTIIEKIDIGGISLIRAAAKNFRNVTVIPSREDYSFLENILKKGNEISLKERHFLASRAFLISSEYDTAIAGYFGQAIPRMDGSAGIPLRYGENPHQKAEFLGSYDLLFNKIQGKELSYNNLVDLDAAYDIIGEFYEESPTFVIIKHTNPCGIATRSTLEEAWKTALSSDPVSAFGGILICNKEVDAATAQEIDKIFYELLAAPSFSPEALAILGKKKKRVLLEIKSLKKQQKMVRSMLNGFIAQDADSKTEKSEDLKVVTETKPKEELIADLLFANKCVKHLKSNAIALAKNGQLIGMGCGQTSRVDALKQAITKAESFGLDLKGSVLASDAFFPFADSVEIAHKAGVIAVIQPGGSIKDQDSIDYCNAHDIPMVFTGNRHFKH
jgi:phosphoribosylaminoimidazolecarboxamide formyltransferase/IMP cyclohydrolase